MATGAAAETKLNVIAYFNEEIVDETKLKYTLLSSIVIVGTLLNAHLMLFINFSNMLHILE